ncbi:MAG TPA: spore cortex biosynthesis protein YabQ [Clostridia bacterium]
MTINEGQGLIFLAFLFGGIVIGLVCELTYTFKVISSNKIYIFILDFLVMLIIGAGLVLWAFLINYGEIRFYSFLSYILGVFLLKAILGKHFESFRKIVYNQFCRLFKDNNEQGKK